MWQNVATGVADLGKRLAEALDDCAAADGLYAGTALPGEQALGVGGSEAECSDTIFMDAINIRGVSKTSRLITSRCNSVISSMI